MPLDAVDQLKNRNLEILDKDFMKDEMEAFETYISEKKKTELKFERKLFLRAQKDAFEDPKHWWNKLATISEKELEMLPYSFLKKYGSYLTQIQTMHTETNFDENLTVRGYYDQIKNLDKLETNEEK